MQIEKKELLDRIFDKLNEQPVECIQSLMNHFSMEASNHFLHNALTMESYHRMQNRCLEYELTIKTILVLSMQGERERLTGLWELLERYIKESIKEFTNVSHQLLEQADKRKEEEKDE